MVKMILGIAGLLTVAVGTPLAGLAILPTIKKKNPEWSEAGLVADLAVNAPQERRFFQTVRSGYYEEKVERTVWLRKKTDGNIVAYSPSCPHLGCGYTWSSNESRFKCPCHASAFDVEGQVLGGPSPRKLDTLETRVENGKVLVKFRIFQPGITEQVEA